MLHRAAFLLSFGLGFASVACWELADVNDPPRQTLWQTCQHFLDNYPPTIPEQCWPFLPDGSPPLVPTWSGVDASLHDAGADAGVDANEP